MTQKGFYSLKVKNISRSQGGSWTLPGYSRVVIIVAQEYRDYTVSVTVFNSNDHRYVNVLACHRIDSITDANIMVVPSSR